MKTIFIQSLADKLFSHIKITQISDTRIISGNYNNNIYQIFYKTNFDTIIISNSGPIHISILQFTKEFPDKKIFIYQLDENFQDIKDNKNIKYISYTDKDATYLERNILYITNNIINDQLYNSNMLADNVKKDYISCFLENTQILPNSVMSSLYPNSHKKIKMFNNPKIQHLQNLGIITEKDRSDILKESEYYLDIDGKYRIEASIYNCKIIDVDTMEVMDYKTPKYETYSSFIKEYL